MSWRKVTEDDLVAALSRKEIDAFSRDFEVNAVATQIRNVCAYVRGCIRTGGSKCQMASDEDALPESLIAPAMAYLRFEIAVRQNLAANESRTKAYEEAVDIFRELKRGDFVPESDGTPSTDTDKATSPAHGEPKPARLLD